MPIKIVSHSQYIEQTEHKLFFERVGSPGSGYSFYCDENGVVDSATLGPAALENYNKCINKVHSVKAGILQPHSWSYREPAIGECGCGCEVVLDSFTNTCDGCERDYNMSGQELAHRSQWGEETGESYCDLQDL